MIPTVNLLPSGRDSEILAPPGPAVGASAPPKILIVDDDPRNLLAMEEILRSPRQKVVLARSGEEALREVLRDDFAVILLDVQMPEIDGYEVASLIRRRPRSSRVPILFLTAFNKDDLDVSRGYSAGAVDYVFKPVDPFILNAKVSILVDLYLKTAEVKEQAELRHRLQEENFRVRTEKLMAERALRRTQERQEAILRTLPVVFTSRALDRPFPALFVSENVQRLTGFPAHLFTGDPEFGASRIHPEDVENVFEALTGAAATGSYSCEYRWLCADGSYRSFFDQGVLAPEEEGGRREIFGTMLDVTERRMLESQLVQAQKMETVGQLTGGIAHDFNNLLTVVLGNLDLLQRNIQSDPRAERQLGAMRHAAERGQSLTRQLLAFSRRQHLSPETLDVNELVRGFDPLVRRAVGEAVILETALTAEAAVIHADPPQLEAAILNLAVNARDAMPEGGRLIIETRRIERDERLSARYPEASPGPWIVIAVRDTGSGMPPEVLERVFEPFFTTKEAGKGSGLGLSQVYGFVRQSDGFVMIDSAPGEGTEIRIYLPPSSEPVAPHLNGAEPSYTAARSETVLVVEDDPAVLALEIEILGDLGYRVLTASDAAGALEILRRGDPIDLVFTDVVMPGGKTGVQLATEARELRNGIKVLLTSGYTGEALARHQDERLDLPLIPKPFRQAELAAKLREVIEAP